jgi:hypothetical protein
MPSLARNRRHRGSPDAISLECENAARRQPSELESEIVPSVLSEHE